MRAIRVKALKENLKKIIPNFNIGQWRRYKKNWLKVKGKFNDS